MIRAALTHPQMVGALGHDVPRIFVLVFALGSALAGLAGVIGGFMLLTQPTLAQAVGPIVFVVVVVGGLGSLAGALIASMLIGILQTLRRGRRLFTARPVPRRRHHRCAWLAVL